MVILHATKFFCRSVFLLFLAVVSSKKFFFEVQKTSINDLGAHLLDQIDEKIQIVLAGENRCEDLP